MRIDNTDSVDGMMPNNSQKTKILTVKEVAAILRVHPSTVSRYATSGELRSYVIGSRRLFREDDIWAFFDNRIASESQVDLGYRKEDRIEHGNHPTTRT
jgi:excisionase family DNA binding protein